jgi:shikimate dehydrogenase
VTDSDTTIIDRYGVIGYPVAHSRSPIIHKQFAEQTGQQMRYELIEAPPSELESSIRQFQRAGGRGLNVTVPHKSEVVRLVDELSEQASIAGAVNTLDISADTIVGHNTDGAGLVRDLVVNVGLSLAGLRVLILGAGGATRGIIGPLLEQDTASIVVANRTPDKAKALVNHFGTMGEVSSARLNRVPNGKTFDLVINATSAGLGGKMPEYPAHAVGENTLCYDLSYGLKETPFVAWAKRAGAGRTRSGWGMLIEQAAESFEIWRGVRPDTAPVMKRLPVS